MVVSSGSVGDPWDDEGFGGEDDWVGGQSLEADLEDDALSGFGADVDDAEPDEDGDETLTDEEP